MTSTRQISEDLLDTILERLEDLQLLRDERDGIDWSQLDGSHSTGTRTATTASAATATPTSTPASGWA